MLDPSTPAITTMLRGLCGEEIVIEAADRDLHSGLYGSAAANPNHVLARILADLHDETGRVTIPGFYEGVHELAPELKEAWDNLPVDAADFLGAVGLSIPAGEQGRSIFEQVWSRPTAEVNGMGGGYQGEGFKTVIPAKASAKVSFRLVFDQDPHAVREAFRAFVRARVPADCTVRFIEHGSGRAIGFPIDAPAFGRTKDALTAEWGREAVFIGSGGSIPVAHELKAEARHGHRAHRLRARGRPHPQPEREIRARELPQGHPLLGQDPGGPRGMSPPAGRLTGVIVPRLTNRPAFRVRPSPAKRSAIQTSALRGWPSSSSESPVATVWPSITVLAVSRSRARPCQSVVSAPRMLPALKALSAMMVPAPAALKSS
jgi:hypothetical protein